MGKRARRKHKRRRQVNDAGVALSATPRLDEVRAWVAELHADRGSDQELEQPTATQVADDTRVPSGSIPPPPWKQTP